MTDKSIQDQVIEDIEERKKVGIENYNTLLYTNNGRSMLQDLYEELLDACCYIKGAIIEQQRFIKLTSVDSFKVSGRGVVLTFDKFPYKLKPKDIIGREVTIDEKLYLVKGVERFPIWGAEDAYIKAPVGLLVEEVDNTIGLMK